MAQLFGGVVAPALFRILIATQNRANRALGYYTGARLMVLGGVVARWLGLDAEGKALEQLAPSVDPTEPAVAG